MVVSEIHIFPVKGLGGIRPDEAEVEPWGLRQDRRWMVVDGDGRFITQREVARMALIQATPTAQGITLALPGHGTLEIETPSATARPLTCVVWSDTVPARDAGMAAHRWLTAALGRDCHLVHLADTAARPLKAAYAVGQDSVSFADGFPVLLTSLASLADLNARLAAPIAITRFRGNIVIDDAPAWAEDGWRLIRIGAATFRVTKPCERCLVTTIDQQTGERPDKTEPLRTLASFRRDPRGLMFGQNLVPVQCARIAVGDSVEVVESGPANVSPFVSTIDAA